MYATMVLVLWSDHRCLSVGVRVRSLPTAFCYCHTMNSRSVACLTGSFSTSHTIAHQPLHRKQSYALAGRRTVSHTYNQTACALFVPAHTGTQGHKVHSRCCRHASKPRVKIQHLYSITQYTYMHVSWLLRSQLTMNGFCQTLIPSSCPTAHHSIIAASLKDQHQSVIR
jgi:hypothetical protein